MWNMQCMIVPVIICATGIVVKCLKTDFEAMPGKHSVYSLQKAAILGTSHKQGKYSSLHFEARAVGIAIVSGEVAGQKGL